jgi:co-chaperonin GroES (HSP10)
MAAPTCIQNNILVELSKTFQDEIIADGGTKFFQDTTFRPEWNVTISGKVASVPQCLTIGDGGAHSFYPDRPNILQVVNPGDEIIFSYVVVMNRSMTDNVGEIYERDKPIDPYITTWTNPNRMRIFRVYLNNNKYECGLFNLKTKIWEDRVKCDERGAEFFLEKYLVEEQVGFNYKNLLPYEGKDYWKVDYINAIAIKRKDGSFDMVGDYVLLEPIREPRRGFEQGIIEVYEIEQDNDHRAIGSIISIGEPLKGQIKLSVKPNDKIVTDIRFAEKYEIDGHDFWVVRQKYIYGKYSVTNEHIGNP